MESLKKEIQDLADLHEEYLRKARCSIGEAEANLGIARKTMEWAEETMEHVVACVENSLDTPKKTLP